MDTVVYMLSNTLNYFPKILQAPAMFIMHIIINLFVTSGSGLLILATVIGYS